MGLFSRSLSGALLAGAKTMALMASLLIAVALSRLLDKESYGAFAQVLMLYALSNIVFRVGIPQSIYYFLPRLDRPEQCGFVLQSVGLLVIQGSMLGIGLYFGAEPIGRAFSSPQLPDLLRAFAPYPALMLPVFAFDNVLMTFDRVRTIIIFNVVTKMVAVVVVVTPIYLGYSMTVAIRAWVMLAVLQAAVAVGLMLRPVLGSSIRISWHRMVEQYSYALPFGLAAILAAIGYYADKVAVSTLGGPELFAVYSNGARELPVVGVISSAVTMTLLPPMVRYAKDGQSELFLGLWRRSQTKVAFVLFPLAAFFGFFAPEAVTVLFGSGYADSAIVFRVFLGLVPARICSFARVMVPLRQNWLYALAHVLQLLVAYPLCFVLFNRFGLFGAAIGLVVAVYANIAFSGYSVARVLRIRIVQVWPLRSVLLILAVGLVCGVLSYLVCWRLPADQFGEKIVRLSVAALVYGALYFLLTWRTGLFNWREWRNAFRSSPQAQVPGDALERLDLADTPGRTTPP